MGITPEFRGLYPLIMQIFFLPSVRGDGKKRKNCRSYFKIVPEVSYKVKFTYEIWAREVAITKLWFGHCRLTSEMHLIKVHPYGLCDFCNIREDVLHYMIDCFEFIQTQEKLVKALLDTNVREKVTNILGNNDFNKVTWEFVRKDI